ncbi:MAG: molybdopterin-synthase adenylyltransferase MoeB [Lentisphaeraceae bacterium]|nr:molybdopterin-synthase adenylyltransferase MoeB [Lentisphaeraceae bacterium]
MSLDKEELIHYSRHLLLSEIGREGQEKLKAAKVLLIGAGGLGCPAAVYLGAAGVGTLSIIDFDKVDVTNLHRQIAFHKSDVGRYKAEVLKERIEANNPYVSVKIYKERFSLENSQTLFDEYDIIVDGCDNFGTRYLSNDAAFFAGKPLVYGAIHKFQGQASVFNLNGGPCYRCLFPEPPEADAVPNCAEAGVLGVLPGIIGTIQATEAVKLIIGSEGSLSGRFLTYDAMQMSFKEFKLGKNPSCPLCGNKPKITSLEEMEILCSSQQEKLAKDSEILPEEVDKIRSSGEDLMIIDLREEYEREICCIKGSEHIPLSMLGSVSKMLPGDKKIVFYCHKGQRSLEAVRSVREQGMKNCFSLAGGIARWADEIEPEMGQY